MEQVDVREVEDSGWGAISLTSGRLSLTVVPDAGGRVMSLKLDDVEALFTLPELRGRSFEVASAEDVRGRKRQLGWLHYGGYKTWLAPQERWTDGLPYLDLDSGLYSASVDARPGFASVRLTSPVCRETGMELTRTVSMSAGSPTSPPQKWQCPPEEVRGWPAHSRRGPGVSRRRIRSRTSSSSHWPPPRSRAVVIPAQTMRRARLSMAGTSSAGGTAS